MMDKEALESKLSPLLRKIFVLLAESIDSQQSAIFHNHIKQTLVDWEATQNKTIDALAGSIHLLLDAFASQLPADSEGVGRLKLIQTCLTPPLLDPELTLLWQNVEQIAQIIKRSPDNNLDELSLNELNKAKHVAGAHKDDGRKVDREVHLPHPTSKETKKGNFSPDLEEQLESPSSPASLELAQSLIPTVADKIQIDVDSDVAQIIEKNIIKPKLVENPQLAAQEEQEQDFAVTEDLTAAHDIFENFKTVSSGSGGDGADTKPLKAPKAVLKMLRFPENNEQDNHFQESESNEFNDIEELADDVNEIDEVSFENQNGREDFSDKNKMEKIHSDFVTQMRAIVAENEKFGVHLSLEIDVLDDATKINQIEDRRKTILASMKKISESHTELAKKFDKAQNYLSIIESDKRKLTDELERARQLSLTDELTSLPNRRAFLRRMDDEVSRVKRYGFSLSLVLIDIDHFKQVNDKYGHAAGDAVLQVYAEKILSIFRHHDMIARYGGEEFAVLLPNTDLDGVLRALDKVKNSVPNVQCKVNNILIPAPTFSAGVTEYRASESPSQFIERADSALYRAKRLGRNRIEVEQKSPEYDPID